MTNLEICNIALSEIGDKSITTFPDSTNQAASVCELHFSRSLDETLGLTYWSDATTQSIVESSSFHTPIYSQSYAIPSDCIDVISVDETEIEQSERYELQGDYILSNNGDSSVVLKFIRRITASEMSHRLAHLFGMVLAKNICMTLTKNARIKQELITMIEQLYLPRYKYKDGRQSKPQDKRRRSNWIRARRTGGRGSGNRGYYRTY